LGSWGIAPSFLISGLDGGEWSTSRLGRFTPRERAPSTHWIRGWVGPIVGLDAVEKRKTLPRQKPNIGRLGRSSPSLYRLSYPHYKSNRDPMIFFKVSWSLFLESYWMVNRSEKCGMIRKFSFVEVIIRAIFLTDQTLLILEQWHPTWQNHVTMSQYLWPRTRSRLSCLGFWIDILETEPK
jgi:hypothetical protein